MIRSGIEVEIVVDGAPLPEYEHHPSGRKYVCMKEGDAYSIRLRSRVLSERRLAVISVDGLSVMDGKEASWGRGGYVLDPRECVDIPGFRLDNQKVARFVAGKPEESYAQKSGGNPSNIGVIGVAMFQEKSPRHSPAQTKGAGGSSARGRGYERFHETEDTLRLEKEEKTCGGILLPGDAVYPDDVKGLLAEPPGLGTKFGEERAHRVEEVPFERMTKTPWLVLTIYYDTAENLQRMGIDVRTQAPLKSPLPFPADQKEPSDVGCTPPPGWQPRG